MKLKAHLRGKARATPVTDARMIRTREALRDAFLGLLERKQLDRISVRDIVAEAGIGYATFFRHHPSKENLLNEIAAEQVGHLMALAFPLLSAAGTRASCVGLCKYVESHRQLWSTLLTGGAAGALRAEFVRLAIAGAGKLRSNHALPLELGAVYGVGATIEILTWWLRRPAGEYSVAQVAEFLDQLVVVPATGYGGGRRGRNRK